MTNFIIAGSLGGWELLVIIAILLLFFGGKKIPELMRGLGKGVGEFKKGMKDGDVEDNGKEPSKEQKE